jgi:UDP-N-acetylglucosamine:LPS N-acetylglucosamine transferase
VDKPTIILATSNGIGMGHLARATAIAEELKSVARPILVSVAGGIAEIPSTTGIPCEYIPGKTRRWMPAHRWDRYFRDRLIAIADETGASVISFDGVVPYPGFIATKLKRPDLTIVWVRRGLWQKNLLRFALPFQSRLVDLIIEPGDIAREYDHGPTSNRKDAILTSPVSLYSKARALSRTDARKLLGLDADRPAVLVQLGTGDSDMNEKMRAALSGLIGWQASHGLQVVLTKNPVDAHGVSLVPDGLEIKVQRYFPLADVLAAFDGAIAATGYNSVHELLPAQIPTVLISNIRGTDDQDARAKWCHDHGYALRADHASLADITATVVTLSDAAVRQSLHNKCAELSNTNGGSEIAQILLSLATSAKKKPSKKVSRFVATQVIHKITYLYRLIRPYKKSVTVDHGAALFSQEIDADYLREHIKGDQRFEHMIVEGSQSYIARRQQIANTAYGK